VRVNVHETNVNLSQLVAAVESGEVDGVEIARAGTVVARIVPAPADRPLRHPGGWKGRGKVHENVEDPLPEFDDAFYGAPLVPRR
jgi:antitoxin (DNA-binding transcriptional repressor) of toxin-antitoxin stability system